ncbi:MAG: tRNA (N(6)-L-threonylcarbamoyladenosine(37)-C(2))-methylthiotransferase MtaB [Desulfobacterales bacterium CG23_combo_of_CG06-09_8_20_14_all_51_8]|nr:MAG: tRNA (N(6)-L-threonylcarbamoyladenosine(37)-C(2))-methylthiotransferase MtaB [Desulfobacterales bacterium CG23_combo_of_CG06-09_8_20_14_all_51_8]
MTEPHRNPLKISITTLGCKVNQCESESLYAGLERICSVERSESVSADICVINTCTVTQKASMQSRQAVRKAIRDNPMAIIVVTGCYAQSEPGTLEKIKGIDYILGNTDKHAISRLFAPPTRMQKLSVPQIICGDIRKMRQIAPITLPVAGNRTRPFIRIQDGCDNFCAYCIVPYTRGPSRSLPPDEVLNIIQNPPAANAKEIVLTGIHLGRYGQDLTPPTSLLGLLAALKNAKIGQRIRLSSLEPLEISDALIKFTADSIMICRHFHVPLQSGDVNILKRMNRTYTPAIFAETIHSIHQAIPEAAIGADIMVGFPGETEAAFKNTFELLKNLPVTYLHVFPFSSRPGTKAVEFSDPVDPQTIKKRRNQLLLLGREKKSAFYSRMIGKTIGVLIEEKREARTGLLTGLTSNYMRVVVDGDDRLKNRIIPCRITGVLNKDAMTGAPA